MNNILTTLYIQQLSFSILTLQVSMTRKKNKKLYSNYKFHKVKISI